MLIETLVEDLPIGLRQKIAVFVIVLAAVLDGVDMQIMALVSPALLKDWAIGKAALGPAISASLIGLAIGAALGGKLSDRYGRKTVLCGALALAAGPTVACALADNIPEIAVLRFLCGLGAGACMPAAATLAAEILPRRWRSPAIAAVTAGVPVGGMIAATIVITVLPNWGWRGAFVLAGVLPLVIAFLAFLILPESPAWQVERGVAHDRVKRALRAFWPGADLPDAFTAKDSAGTAQKTTLFNQENKRVNSGVFLAFLANSMALGGYLTWGPVLLTGVGYTMGQAVGTIFYVNLISVLATLTMSFFVVRLGTRTILALSSIISLTATVTMAVIAMSGAVEGIAPGVVVAGGCLIINQTLLFVIVTNAYPVTNRSTALGIGASLGRGGSIVAAMTFGVLLSLPTPAWFFVSIAAGTVLVAIAAFIIDRHVKPGKPSAA